VSPNRLAAAKGLEQSGDLDFADAAEGLDESGQAWRLDAVVIREKNLER
jgi:hypothetical protein